jgi:hypothetical protein
MEQMRWCRILAAAGVAAALLLPGTAGAAPEQHLGLHDMTCSGITAMGMGLPRRSSLHLTLVDQDNGATLLTRTVRTSVTGAFEVRLDAQLNQVLSIRLLVSRPDGTKIGFADHVMATGAPMCDLPFTGPARAGALLGLGGGLLGLGLLLLLGARRGAADRG